MSVDCLFYNKNHEFKVSMISVFILIILSFLTFLSIFVKFDFITSYNGIVVLEDDYYVYFLLDNNEIVNIKQQNMVINKQYVDFSIVKIDSDYVLSDDGPKKGVYFKFDLDESDKIINNVVNVNFVSRKTIFSKVKEMFT